MKNSDRKAQITRIRRKIAEQNEKLHQLWEALHQLIAECDHSSTKELPEDDPEWGSYDTVECVICGEYVERKSTENEPRTDS